MNGGFISIWASLIIVGLFMPFIPYMTRKTENFGISIPEHLYNRMDFKKMRKKYTSYLFVVFVLLLIIASLLFYMLPEKLTILFISIVIMLELVASFVLYLWFHFEMKKIKQSENWTQENKQGVVIDTTFRDEKLTHSNWWFLVPGMIILGTIIFTNFMYDQIPNEIPMHTDFSGNVRYDNKTIGNMLLMPAMQLFMLGMFLCINLVIKHSKQQLSGANPDRSKFQNVLFRRYWSLYMILSSLLMVLLFGFVQITFIYPTLETYTELVITVTIIILLLGTILLSIKTGQGGSRIKIEDKEVNKNIDRDDDRYWKLGQFYVNKNDPSIFIEKRFGVGWTNNWAHPLSWVFIVGIIALPIIIVSILIYL